MGEEEEASFSEQNAEAKWAIAFAANAWRKARGWLFRSPVSDRNIYSFFKRESQEKYLRFVSSIVFFTTPLSCFPPSR